MKSDSSFSPEEECDGSGGASPSLPFLSCDDIVVCDAENDRIDRYLSRTLGFSRNFVQNLLRNGNVRIDGANAVKQSARVFSGMKISVAIPQPRSSDITPEDVPFDVLFEDDHILVIAKPSGIVVHPGPGNWTGTLVHGLLHRYPDIGNIGNVLRPGSYTARRRDIGLLIVARFADRSGSIAGTIQGEKRRKGISRCRPRSAGKKIGDN
jgi:23S rRNA pseudouridine1911/1915/1917 synthase